MIRELDTWFSRQH